MSDAERQTAAPGGSRNDDPGQGPSLKLLYTLLALALAAAIGVALMIVLPFYYRR